LSQRKPNHPQDNEGERGVDDDLKPRHGVSLVTVGSISPDVGPAPSRLPPTIGCMRDLQPGDEMRCPHCRRWHPLIQKHTEGTDTAVDMLFFECAGLSYFGGFINRGSRHEIRKRRESRRQRLLTGSPSPLATTRKG
jgi:hypothetical protein